MFALLVVPTIQTWRDYGRRFGTPIMILAALLWLQGFHSIEHVAQWIEFHIFGWQAKQSSGLIAAASAEWIHFWWSVGETSLLLLAAHAYMRRMWDRLHPSLPGGQ